MRVFRSTVFEDESSSARIRLISLIFNKRLNKRFIPRTDFFRIIRKVKFPLRQTPSGFFLPLTKANAVQRKFNKPFPTLKIPASFPSFPLRRQILPRVLTFGVNRARCVAGWRGEQHTSCKFRVTAYINLVIQWKVKQSPRSHLCHYHPYPTSFLRSISPSPL